MPCLIVASATLSCAPAPSPGSTAVLESEPTDWRAPPEPESEPEPPPPPPDADSPDPGDDGDVPQLELKQMMGHAIYTPDPSAIELYQSKAAQLKKDGASVIAFCVTTEGEVSDVRVIQKFPHDPEIDAILADTIERWRFKPFIIDGRPAKVCTTRTFNLKFR